VGAVGEDGKLALGVGGGGGVGILIDDRLIGGAGVIEVALEFARHGGVEEFAGEALGILGIGVAAFFQTLLNIFDVFESWIRIAQRL